MIDRDMVLFLNKNKHIADNFLLDKSVLELGSGQALALLLLRNAKNKLMTDAYLRRYQKKKRRSEKREIVDMAKSTGKPMKRTPIK